MHSSQSTLNNLAAILLLIMVGLAPIPAGANLPVYWAIGAMLVGSLLFGYIAWILLIDSSLRADAQMGWKLQLR